MNVTVKFGSDTYNRTYAEGSTIANVLADHDLKAVTGWGDNVRALIGSVEQSRTALLPDGALVVVETKANDKAN